MQVVHPLAGDGDGVAPAAVDVDGERVAVDEDGRFEVDSDAAEAWLQAFAARYDVAPEELRVDDDSSAETCQVTKNDGEVCGRELPCPYHSDDDTGGDDS